jgi:hypothetical protein
MKRIFTAAAAVLGLLAAMGFAACDKAQEGRTPSAGDPSNRMESRLTEASERLSEGLTDLSERVSEGLTDASEKLSEGMSEANEKLSEGLSRAAD